MSEKEKAYMPMGSAGLVRYFDAEPGIKMQPQAVIYLTFGFIGVVMAVKLLAG